MFKEVIQIGEKLLVGAMMKTSMSEYVPIGRAKLNIKHSRPTDFKQVDQETLDLANADPELLKQLLAKGAKEMGGGALYVPNPDSYITLDEQEVWNQITNSGRDQLHLQGYGTSGLATNGFNYIGLTNTAITPAAGDTSLSGEITSNGLSRAQGAYAHTTGTNTTTISYTFTATGTQACQAAALFNLAGPPVAGIMNHELTFTQRSLISGDTLAVTYTITLG
jgi:hypothetical protein